MIKDVLKYIYYSYKGLPYILYKNNLIKKYHFKLVTEIKARNKCNVVFFASNLPMWKYQRLYELLVHDKRFNVYVLLVGFKNNNIEQNTQWLDTLSEYFDNNGVEYIDTRKFSFKNFDIKKVINPDILFYPQPYDNLYEDKFAYTTFIDKLLVYTPYALWTGNDRWGFDETFHNLAWRLYYANDVNYKLAKKLSISHGRAVRVVGYPNADNFLFDNHKDVWKNSNSLRKKIIWAPHYSINPQKCLIPQSQFLCIAELMVEIAKEYSNEIQIAFKPHPRLYRELVNIWGEEKTKKYFEIWDTMPNTQVENGLYVDLFMTSDALIHDCGSFTAEYLYTQKPVMFLTDNINEHKKVLNEFGAVAFNCHYFGINEQDIRSFISNVVIKGTDPKKEERRIFFQKHLLPPNGCTVAENMYNDIVNSIFG